MKKVRIYVNPSSDTTNILMGFIAENIDEINKRVVVERVLVTKRNFKDLQQRGIKKTPTLVYEGKQYIGAQKIMRILKPPSAYKDNYGASTSPEEMVQKYLARAIAPENGEEEDEVENRDTQIRQRMAALDKRRQEMIGGVKNPGAKAKKSGRRSTTTHRRRI